MLFGQNNIYQYFSPFWQYGILFMYDILCSGIKQVLNMFMMSTWISTNESWSGFNGLFTILMVLYYNNYNNITDSEIVQFVELFIQFSAVS